MGPLQEQTLVSELVRIPDSHFCLRRDRGEGLHLAEPHALPRKVGTGVDYRCEPSCADI